MSLTPAQRAAAATRAPLVLCLAAPGSGKTKTLTERIVSLLDEGVHPTEILALTFTRKAAREMRERLETARTERKARWSARRVLLSTFHSWALVTLREYHDIIGWPAGFTVRDERDHVDVLCFLAAERDPKIKACTSQDGRKRRAASQWKEPEVRALYRRLMREAGAIDYDMLEEEMARLLRDERVAAELRRRWPHVLVDEGQDTSKRQQEILAALAPSNRFDVGDPGQSIYSFRGAHMAGFLALAEVEGVEVHRLDTNWRSDPEIVACVSRSAAAMTPRGLEQTAGRAAGEGGAVGLLDRPTGDDLRAAIAADLLAAHEAGIPWGECAVLAPQWFPLEQLAKVLAEAGIPAHCPRADLGPWSTDEARWLVNLLRVALNPADHLALWEVLSHAAQRVRMWDWSPMRAEAIRGGRPILEVALDAANAGRLTDAARDLVLAVGGVRGCAAAGEDLVAFDGALATLRQELDRLHLASRLVDLAHVGEALAQWRAGAEEKTVAAFLDWFAEREIHDAEKVEEGEGRVALLSVHAAKGLEWRAVWVLAEEGQLPRSTSPGPGMEEERRVFYVAASRARDRLRFCWRGSKGGPSRFVFEALGVEELVTPDSPPAIHDFEEMPF